MSYVQLYIRQRTS